jgi:hypothetical protein
MYHPLPREVQIKLSKIHGEGLFAKEDIDDNTKIGLGWLVVGAELIRTPLGGFINHSDTPNTIKIQKDNRYYLYTIREIKKGEELTLKYTFYSVKNELGTK